MTLNAAPATAVTLNAAPAVTLPAAPATPAVTLPAAVPAAAAPNQADLNAQLAGLAALVPQLKGLSALSTSQSPAGLASFDAISGASLNLLNKVRTNRLQYKNNQDILQVTSRVQSTVKSLMNMLSFPLLSLRSLLRPSP